MPVNRNIIFHLNWAFSLKAIRNCISFSYLSWSMWLVIWNLAENLCIQVLWSGWATNNSYLHIISFKEEELFKIFVFLIERSIAVVCSSSFVSFWWQDGTMSFLIERSRAAIWYSLFIYIWFWEYPWIGKSELSLLWLKYVQMYMHVRSSALINRVLQLHPFWTVFFFIRQIA